MARCLYPGLVYRLPTQISCYIQELFELLPVIMPLYDRARTLCDFNIDVWFPPHSFTIDFVNLIESLNLVQSVEGASHCERYTLHLVLSSGFTQEDVEAIDVCLTTKQSFSRLLHPPFLSLVLLFYLSSSTQYLLVDSVRPSQILLTVMPLSRLRVALMS